MKPTIKKRGEIMKKAMTVLSLVFIMAIALYGCYEKSSKQDEKKMKISFQDGYVEIQFNSDQFAGFTGGKNLLEISGEIYWNSDRTGWKEEATLSGDITYDSDGKLICEIEGMPNNDKGTFSAMSKDGERIWLIPSMWELDLNAVLNSEELIVYSLLQDDPVLNDSTIRFIFGGIADISFGSDTFSGFTGSKNLYEISDQRIYWNSDKTGWNNEATLSGVITSDSGGNLNCRIEGMPNNDKGTFSAMTKTGERIWLIPDTWNLSLNTTMSSEDLIVYSLGDQVVFYEPTIEFSDGVAKIYFGSDKFTGFTGNKELYEISDQIIWWNSDRTGWNNEATLSGVITSDSGGNLNCRIEGMPNNDKGTFSAMTKTGEKIWLVPTTWKLSSNTSTDAEGLIFYSSGEEPVFYEPTIRFIFGGTVEISFGSDQFAGFTGDKSLSEIDQRIWWQSDRTGWYGEATLSGAITTDSNGNLFCRITGMPNNDKGTFAIMTKAGERIWLIPPMWNLSANASVDDYNGLIIYSTY